MWKMRLLFTQSFLLGSCLLSSVAGCGGSAESPKTDQGTSAVERSDVEKATGTGVAMAARKQAEDEGKYSRRKTSQADSENGPGGSLTKEKSVQMLKILFLCTGNSCRSQMAEGWARHLKGDIFEAYSAGVEKHGLNPNAVKVMAEAGVDISGHRSKHLDELGDVKFDHVVTVCGNAHESCPVFPGGTKVTHVGFDDPPRLAQGAAGEEEALEHYRRVRDEIRSFVETLPAALL